MHIFTEISGGIYHILLAIFISCFLANISRAQPSGSINNNLVSGILVDSSTHEVISYATVVVQITQAKKTIKSVLSQDDGTFEVTGLSPAEQYQIIISHVGFTTKAINLPFPAPSVFHLGTVGLVPSVTLLTEVEVLAEIPLIEFDLDKVIYNVEADPESVILNSLDILRKVPMLAVDAEDNLQLNGNSNYLVMINGKRSSLFAGNPSDLFRSLPASAIKKIEVSTTPSSRFEANGAGGIINIITHKNSISGYHGALNLGATTPKGYTTNANLSLTSSKFSFAGQISHNNVINPVSKSKFIRKDLLNESELEQTSEGRGRSRSYTINKEITYDLSLYDQIRISYNSTRSNSTNAFVQLVKLKNAAEELTEAYQNNNNAKLQGSGNALSLDYQHSFKKNDQQLFTLSLDFMNSNNTNYTAFMLQPHYNYTEQETLTNTDDRSIEYTIQADYVQPIGKQTLETGFKSMFLKSNSDYAYTNRDVASGAFITDSSQSNNFNYTQDLHTAYASLNLLKNKWGLRAGVRFEMTLLNANFRSSATNANQNYANLFPNIILTRRLAGTKTVKLSYNQRIQRPDLYYLNPYVDLTDPLNISYGNPALNPATSHIFQLDYTAFVKGTSLNASLAHNYTNNSIQDFTTIATDSIAHTTFGNLGQNQSYGLSVGSNSTFFKKLGITINSNTQYVKYNSILEGRSQRNNGFTYAIQSNVSYRFGKSWRINTNVGYNSGNILLQGKTAGYVHNIFTVNKEFSKNKKAVISLSIRNPLQQNRHLVTELSGTTFHQVRESYLIIRQYSISINYRFAKLK
jgi:ferric enterobactin receptor